jgi:hypothetical protein
MELKLIILVDHVHRPEFYVTRKLCFWNWICCRPHVRGGRHLLCWGPLERANLNHCSFTWLLPTALWTLFGNDSPWLQPSERCLGIIALGDSFQNAVWKWYLLAATMWTLFLNDSPWLQPSERSLEMIAFVFNFNFGSRKKIPWWEIWFRFHNSW